MLRDPNSCANLNDFQTSHLHLELEIDFEKSILKGHVLLTVKRTSEEELKAVLLDAAHLEIVNVTCDDSFLSVRPSFNLIFYILVVCLYWKSYSLW